MPRLMTDTEAAVLLDIKPKTLVSWARKGWIPAHPLGEGKRRFWRFFEHELMDWLAKRKGGRE